MICIICKTEKQSEVFSLGAYGKMATNVNYLIGICFVCYLKAPNYIPVQQIKRWLENDKNGN